jgi:uncharacterized membrane protein YkvA (DUF1232 family)
MFAFLTFAVLTGAACWGLKQWLAYHERQQFIARVETRQRDTGQVIDVTEAQRLYATAQPKLAAPHKGGMSKWLVMGLCALYIVCPIDVIPDFIPVLGWGDDLAAAMIGIRAMFK